jgi:hypothetical protein
VSFEDRGAAPGTRYAYRLFVQSAHDQGYAGEVWVDVPGTSAAPLAMRLNPIFPNPFETEAQLSFAIAKAGPARLSIYSVSGRRIATVVDQDLPVGWRAITWNGRDASGQQVASGTYLARLESGGAVQIRKFVLAR